MQHIEIKDLAQQIGALLAALTQGEEVVLTDAQRPVAKLVKLESAAPENTVTRGLEMARLLEQLAARDPFSEISDPVTWQREARQDRPLPGRE